MSVFSGLAIDYYNQRLYWADSELSQIGSVRFDGSDSLVAASSRDGGFACVGNCTMFRIWFQINIFSSGQRSVPAFEELQSKAEDHCSLYKLTLPHFHFGSLSDCDWKNAILEKASVDNEFESKAFAKPSELSAAYINSF